MIPKRARVVSSSLIACAGCCLTAPAGSQEGAIARDWRHRVATTDFIKTGNAEWTSAWVETPFRYDELVYCWHLNRPGDSFRLYLKAGFGTGDETDWLYAGYWGQLEQPVTNRTALAFDRGVLDMDWLKLRTNATSFRFRVLSTGKPGLEWPPAVTVVVTASSNGPITARELPAHPASSAPHALVLDIPLRRQFDSAGLRMKDRCQSAALASAMEYFGKSVPLEEITRHTYDPEYAYPGIWPRVIAAAQEFGFEGYVDRFRDWEQVRQAVAENKVLLCSMRLREGECEAAPYASMGNHIVALCGVTDDGRVVVTDSALGKSGTGYLCQWRQADFEKVWIKTKGGIAMVICPPKGCRQRLVNNLPPFPANRSFLEGDDH